MRSAPLSLLLADAAEPATDIAAFSRTVDTRGRAGRKVALRPLLLASGGSEVGAAVWVPGLPADAAAGRPLLPARGTAPGARLSVGGSAAGRRPRCARLRGASVAVGREA